MNENWDIKCRRYYEATFNDGPRATLKHALASFSKEEVTEHSALDLGCGAGGDSLSLSDAGWTVVAVDAQAIAQEFFSRKIPSEKRGQVTFVISTFEDIKLSKKFTLVNASRSLPFCSRECFPDVMKKILNAILPNGRFAGHFFGPRDEMNANTVLTKEEVEAYFEGFKIEHFKEKEWDRPSQGKPLHRHRFSVVAKKI